LLCSQRLECDQCNLVLVVVRCKGGGGLGPVGPDRGCLGLGRGSTRSPGSGLDWVGPVIWWVGLSLGRCRGVDFNPDLGSGPDHF